MAVLFATKSTINTAPILNETDTFIPPEEFAVIFIKDAENNRAIILERVGHALEHLTQLLDQLPYLLGALEVREQLSKQGGPV